MDYFQTLGVERKFDIDFNTLEKNYLQLQQQFHPDKYSGKSSIERTAALQKTADINQAYEALRSPMGRAEYLLELNGIKTKERDLSEKVDNEILMESMEQREALEATDNLAELEVLSESVKKNILERHKELRKEFDAHQYGKALKTVIRLKYHEKFLQEVRLKKLKLEKESNAA